MKFFNFLRKTEQKEKPGRFSDFFLHTSKEEQEEVLKAAAYKANKEQQKVFSRSHLTIKAG